jgi:hypothetical protein
MREAWDYGSASTVIPYWPHHPCVLHTAAMQSRRGVEIFACPIFNRHLKKSLNYGNARLVRYIMENDDHV